MFEWREKKAKQNRKTETMNEHQYAMHETATETATAAATAIVLWRLLIIFKACCDVYVRSRNNETAGMIMAQSEAMIATNMYV